MGSVEDEQAEHGIWPQIRPLRRFVLEHAKLRLEVELRIELGPRSQVDLTGKFWTIAKVDMRVLAESARLAKEIVEEETIPLIIDWGPLYDEHYDTICGMACFLDRLQVLASSSWEGAQPR
ncbi:hypothetical protein Slin15195_G078950 [Septoria linicola]|uniref:Uncharacterized protein n=1 Tax=Septoria linicola TaxID=215465 RepID=A0A9Q9AZG8_9PEZI|nr:hypothetical protein Slin14017_G040150 [Septoria linicola]USW54576.1 hypothetical protein Slin15195_G078950 [Septoria linicola]